MLRVLVAMLLILAVVVGCGGASTPVGQTEAPTSAAALASPTIVAQAPTASPTATQPPRATATPQPTNTPKPTLTPTPAPQSLKLVAYGYGDGLLGPSYALVVENPNKGMAIANSKLQVVAYDAAGTILKVESATVSLVQPGERTGVAGTLIGVKAKDIARVDVQGQSGKQIASNVTLGFTSDNVKFVAGNYGMNKVTGIVKSPYSKNFTMAMVSAVAWDAQGNVIGGGFTFADLLAGAQTAVEVSVGVTGTPARVEIFAQPSTLDTMMY